MLFSEILMPVKFVQLSNAFFSIEVTVSGIVINFKFVHPENIFFSIDVTPFSIVTDFIRLLNEYHGLKTDE